jgi:predicted lipid-binding transport protein (Tim44 family)
MAGKHRARAQEEQQQAAYDQGQQDAYGTMPAAQAAPPPQAPPAAAGGISPEDVSRLQELGKLREQGILTDEEFSQQKALILGSG